MPAEHCLLPENGCLHVVDRRCLCSCEDCLSVLRARGSARIPSRVGDGDFSIGSGVWPGTSKLLEEQGELVQVLGKLMAIGGETKHWSGDLRAMLVEELADVQAAVAFFIEVNLTGAEQDRIDARFLEKLHRFYDWQKNPTKP